MKQVYILAHETARRNALEAVRDALMNAVQKTSIAVKIGEPAKLLEQRCGL